jgi:succinate dehydrogenase / fumarate reductase membrane anchor subunit
MTTALKKAKGLGAANNGSNHWWLQRLSAILLLPLVAWFIVKSLMVFSAGQGLEVIFMAKTSLILFTILLITALYHSTLGMQVIIEDYVQSKVSKFALLIFIKLFAIVTAIFLIFALFSLYIKLLLG